MNEHPLRTPARLARWVMLRTGDGPLRRFWWLAYAVLMKGVAVLLRFAAPGADVYVRGGFAIGDPVFGFSDVDLIVVLRGDPDRPGAEGWRLRRRIQRAYRALPALRDVVELTVFERAEIEQAFFAPFLAVGRFFGQGRAAGELGPAVRPDASARLYGPLRPRWRLVLGRDRLSELPESPDEYRWLWAWPELQFLWKHMFRTCARPELPQTAYFCTKFVAQPARLWLWLAHGERVLGSNAEVLQRALRLMPEDEDMLRTALELRGELIRSPEPPLAEVLAWLLRMTSRVAGLLADELAGAGTTEVRLLGGDPAELVLAAGVLGPDAQALPLTDWRARVLPGAPDEAFVRVAGDPADPEVLGSTALSTKASPYQALVSDGLLFLPTATEGVRPLSPTAFRAVQSRLTDPVSFAVLAGEPACLFPNALGWSARDSARRAVAEHRAWLAADEEPSFERCVGMLLSAVRSALFAESVETGEPQLALTLVAAARALGERDPAARTVADEALARYHASRLGGREPPSRVVSALEELVLGLPAYRK